MANSLYDFATSEASNSTTGGVNTAENQAPSTVNDAMRAWKQLEAAWLDDLGAVNTVAGSATAITVTLTQGFTAYGTGAGQIPNGAVIAIKTGSAATGAATLNVNSIGTKAIRRQGDSAIQANDWLSGATIILRYDTAYNTAAGAWVLVSTGGGAVTEAGTQTLTNKTLTSPAINSGALSGAFSGAVTRTGAETFNVAQNSGLNIRSSDGTSLQAILYNTSDNTFSVGTITNHPIAFYTNNSQKAAFTAAGVLDLSAGAGIGNIKFPATQSASADANTLDDYEELNEAAISQGAGITASTGTITTASGDRSYIKVGRMVTVTYNVTITTIGTGGGGLVLTLPFTAASNGGPWAGVMWTSASGNAFVGTIQEGATTAVTFSTSSMASGASTVFTITYFAAA